MLNTDMKGVQSSLKRRYTDIVKPMFYETVVKS